MRTFHTASPPLANGPSQPSTESFLGNVRHLGFECGVEGTALGEIREHFHAVARRERFPVGQPVEYDSYQFEHQVPGGVISNLRRQLEQLGSAHRLEEILEETIRVRKELGYPIMVTPFSQFVVTQATVNVIQNERYKTLSDEIIKFALGHFGKQVRPVDENLLERIHALPGSKELAGREKPRTSIADLRRQIGAGYSDDELLLMALVSEEDFAAMKAAGPIRTGPAAGSRNLVDFIKELARQESPRFIRVENRAFSLTLRASGKRRDGRGAPGPGGDGAEGRASS